MKKLTDMVVLIRGTGELASGVTHRLYSSHFQICITDIDQPQAVRCAVSFCEAIYDGEKKVEGLTVGCNLNASTACLRAESRESWRRCSV